MLACRDNDACSRAGHADYSVRGKRGIASAGLRVNVFGQSLTGPLVARWCKASSRLSTGLLLTTNKSECRRSRTHLTRAHHGWRMTEIKRLKLAKDLLEEGLSDERVESCTGVSLAEIIGLRAELATGRRSRADYFPGRSYWRP